MSALAGRRGAGASSPALLPIPDRAGTRGFTLVEVMFAVFVGALLVTVTYQAVLAQRVQARKAAEASVMMGFAQTYLEYLRNEEFPNIIVGRRINTAWPDILVPAAGTWEDLTENRYLVFYPDLLYVRERQPELSVALETRNDAVGDPRSRHITVTVRWTRLREGTRGDDQGQVIRLEATVFDDFQ